MILLDQVHRTYRVGDTSFSALDGLSLHLPAGGLTYIRGRSGSGKSTLLHLIAGLDAPTSGRVEVHGAGLHTMNAPARAVFRGHTVGVVFQDFLLLPTLSVHDNVRVAMDLVGRIPRPQRDRRTTELLQRMGIADQSDKHPTALSGGQQQRVAIARALANDPPLIVADEPTGNLDSRTASDVLSVLAELADSGRTVLVATHDPAPSVKARQCITLVDGRLA